MGTISIAPSLFIYTQLKTPSSLTSDDAIVWAVEFCRCSIPTSRLGWGTFATYVLHLPYVKTIESNMRMSVPYPIIYFYGGSCACLSCSQALVGLHRTCHALTPQTYYYSSTLTCDTESNYIVVHTHEDVSIAICCCYRYTRFRC